MARSWLLSLKVAFMSAGVLLTALMLKLSLPLFVEFLNYDLPLLWSVAVFWLKPPYLYLILNCIIITIVASSKLQPQKSEADGSGIASHPVQIKAHERVRFADQSPIKPAFGRSDAVLGGSPVLFGYVDDVEEKKSAEAVVATGEGEAAQEDVDGCETESEDFVLSRSSRMPPQKRDPGEYYAAYVEKPLVSQRFGYRKSAKASPEGGKALLGVSKPKRQETLESTWRTITEGRPMPLTRHLRKSETWDTRGARSGDDSPAMSPAHVMSKAETFNDRTTSNSNDSSLSPSPGGRSGRLRRQPSLSQDELNRRVEAFIRKFNEEMRLQRQESLSQYREMVGRGSR